MPNTIADNSKADVLARLSPFAYPTEARTTALAQTTHSVGEQESAQKLSSWPKSLKTTRKKRQHQTPTTTPPRALTREGEVAMVSQLAMTPKLEKKSPSRSQKSPERLNATAMGKLTQPKPL